MNIRLVLACLFLPAAAWADDQPDGQALYLEHCASCHGAQLQGEANWKTPREDGTLPAPPHDATGHTWHHGDRLLFAYTKFGGAALMAARGMSGFNSGMPGFGETLSDAEIGAILSHIKSTWPDDIRRVQAERSAAEAAMAN